METTIFYFSATGNSLIMARKIAAELGETTLVSIPEVIKSPAATDTPRIGLVFPVYAWGLPRMVEEFAQQLRATTSQYVFAVATCGGTAGGTLRQLQQILRRNSGDLHAGFVVKYDGNRSMKQALVVKVVIWLARNTRPKPAQERLRDIVTTIRQQQRHKPETSALAANVLGTSLLHATAINVFKTSDKGFWVNEDCAHCGTCARICPRQNITIENSTVIWHQNCEFCLGCLNWCPQQAIRHKNEGGTASRYHHPEVTLQEVIRR